MYGIFDKMYGNTVEKIHAIQASGSNGGEMGGYYYYIGTSKYCIPESIKL